MTSAPLPRHLPEAAADRCLDQVRQVGCVVFGNMAVASWPERLEALLEMTIEAGEPWEEAM